MIKNITFCEGCIRDGDCKNQKLFIDDMLSFIGENAPNIITPEGDSSLSVSCNDFKEKTIIT